MRILAVHPVYPANRRIIYLPMGLATMCAVAQKCGHEVKVLDMHNEKLSHRALEKELLNRDYQVCMMGGFAMQVAEMKVVARIVKRLQPSCQVILGGVGVSVIPEVVMEYSGCDAISIGEAELTFPSVLRSIEEGHPYEGTVGFAYRKADQIVRSPKGSSPDNLDELPWPAYHLFNVDLISRYSYNGRNGRSIHVMTSRGCPFKCNFCINSVLNSQAILKEIHGEVLDVGPKRSQRFRSTKKIVEEIQFLRSTYGINDFHFADEEFIAHRRRLEEVCNAIEPLGITWSTSGRADWATEDKLKRMKKAGCHYVLFGVESGSQDMLNLMEKNAKITAVSAGLQSARKVGMDFIANFMIGHPGETEETVRETVEFCKERQIACIPSYVTLFPNSKMFHLVVKKVKDWEHYFKWLSRVDYTRKCFINLTNLSEKRLKSLRAWVITETMATTLFPSFRGLFRKTAVSILAVGLAMTDRLSDTPRLFIRDFFRYTMSVWIRIRRQKKEGHQIASHDLGQRLPENLGEDAYEESLRELESSSRTQ